MMELKQVLEMMDMVVENPSEKNLIRLKKIMETYEGKLPCPDCGELKISKNGFRQYKDGSKTPDYLCVNQDCKRTSFCVFSIIRKRLREKYPHCPKCGSNDEVIKRGKQGTLKKERFKCKKCHITFYASSPNSLPMNLTLEELMAL